MGDDEERTAAEVIGGWLDGVREERGISRRALAGSLRTDRKNVYRWLDGENEPTASNLLSLFAALGMVVVPAPPEDMPVSVSPEVWSMTRSIWEMWDEQRDQGEVGADFLAEAAGAAEAPELLVLARRLRSLEEKVEQGGESTTRAVRALTRAIERLERRLDDESPPASVRAGG